MSRIETEHNGVGIVYSDNEDKWVCYALDLEADKLSALKTKINKVLADERRVAGVSVLRVSTYGGDHEPGKVTLIDGGDVWVMFPAGYLRGRYERARREKVDMRHLVLDTPENRAALDAFAQESRRLRQLEAENQDRRAAIPRVTVSDLKGASGCAKADDQP